MQHILELGDEEVVEGLRVTRFFRYMHIWSDRLENNCYLYPTITTVSNAKFQIPHFYVFEVGEMVSLLMPLCTSQFSLQSPRCLDKQAYIVACCGLSSFFVKPLSRQFQSLKYIKQRCKNIL